MSDTPDSATAETALIKRVSLLWPRAFRGDFEDLHTRPFGDRKSGFIVSANYRPWAVEVVAGARYMGRQEFRDRLLPYEKLLDQGGAIGIIVISEDGLSTNIQSGLGFLPIKIHHYTLADIEAGKTIDLEALNNEETFINEVAEAITARFNKVIRSSRLGQSFPEISFMSDNGVAGVKSWLAMPVPAGRMSQGKFNRIFKHYEDAVKDGVAGGILIVTQRTLKARPKVRPSGRPITIVACTLAQLKSGEIDEFDLVVGENGLTPEEQRRKDDEDSAYPGRVIDIDRESQSYKNAMKAMDSLSEGIRGANSPVLRDDRNERLLKDVDMGRALLSSGTVREDAARALLSTPLKWIRDQAAQASLRELAAEAIKWLRDIFKGVDWFS